MNKILFLLIILLVIQISCNKEIIPQDSETDVKEEYSILTQEKDNEEIGIDDTIEKYFVFDLGDRELSVLLMNDGNLKYENGEYLEASEIYWNAILADPSYLYPHYFYASCLALLYELGEEVDINKINRELVFAQRLDATELDLEEDWMWQRMQQDSDLDSVREFDWFVKYEGDNEQEFRAEILFYDLNNYILEKCLNEDELITAMEIINKLYEIEYHRDFNFMISYNKSINQAKILYYNKYMELLEDDILDIMNSYINGDIENASNLAKYIYNNVNYDKNMTQFVLISELEKISAHWDLVEWLDLDINNARFNIASFFSNDIYVNRKIINGFKGFDDFSLYPYQLAILTQDELKIVADSITADNPNNTSFKPSAFLKTEEIDLEYEFDIVGYWHMGYDTLPADLDILSIQDDNTFEYIFTKYNSTSRYDNMSGTWTLIGNVLKLSVDRYDYNTGLNISPPTMPSLCEYTGKEERFLEEPLIIELLIDEDIMANKANIVPLYIELGGCLFYKKELTNQ